MLTGVRYTTHKEDAELPLAEFQLDPATNQVSVVSGEDSRLVQLALANGIEIEDDWQYAVEVGKKHGVTMPSQSRTYTVKDGLQFLVALMTFYRGNHYMGMYPVTR